MRVKMTEIDLTKIAKKLQKQYTSVSVGEDLPDLFDYISTGNKALDIILDGGIPFGYCVEMSGFSSSGKSLLISQLISQAMARYNAIGILADRENAYTKQRGEQLGIDNKKLLLAKPMDIPIITDCFSFLISSIDMIREQDYLRKYGDSYNPTDKKKTYVLESSERTKIIVGIDSVSAFDKDVDLIKSDQGRKAKMTHEGLRKLLNYIDTDVLLLVANQITYDVGVLYGNNKRTSSGEAMKYYSTIRLQLQEKRKVLDKHNDVIGNYIDIEVIKTRLGPCYRATSIKHLYSTGIEYWSGYARLLVDRGYLKPSNKSEFDSFKNNQVVNVATKEKFNENNIEDYLKEHPELNFNTYPERYTGVVSEDDD